MYIYIYTYRVILRYYKTTFHLSRIQNLIRPSVAVQGFAGVKPAALQLSWKQKFGSSARGCVSLGLRFTKMT